MLMGVFHCPCGRLGNLFLVVAVECQVVQRPSGEVLDVGGGRIPPHGVRKDLYPTHLADASLFVVIVP